MCYVAGSESIFVEYDAEADVMVVCSIMMAMTAMMIYVRIGLPSFDFGERWRAVPL